MVLKCNDGDIITSSCTTIAIKSGPFHLLSFPVHSPPLPCFCLLLPPEEDAEDPEPTEPHQMVTLWSPTSPPPTWQLVAGWGLVFLCRSNHSCESVSAPPYVFNASYYVLRAGKCSVIIFNLKWGLGLTRCNMQIAVLWLNVWWFTGTFFNNIICDGFFCVVGS